MLSRALQVSRHFEITVFVLSFLVAANVSPAVTSVWKAWHRIAHVGWPSPIATFDGAAGRYPYTEYRPATPLFKALHLNLIAGFALLAAAVLGAVGRVESSQTATLNRRHRNAVIGLCVAGAVGCLLRWPSYWFELWIAGGVLTLFAVIYQGRSGIVSDTPIRKFSLRTWFLAFLALSIAFGWLAQAHNVNREGLEFTSVEWIDHATAIACAFLLGLRALFALLHRQALQASILALGSSLFMAANVWMSPAELEHLWWGRRTWFGVHELTAAALFPFGLIYFTQLVSLQTVPAEQAAVSQIVPHLPTGTFWSGVFACVGCIIVCVGCNWLDLPRPILSILLITAYVGWVKVGWGIASLA